MYGCCDASGFGNGVPLHSGRTVIKVNPSEWIEVLPCNIIVHDQRFPSKLYLYSPCDTTGIRSGRHHCRSNHNNGKICRWCCRRRRRRGRGGVCTIVSAIVAGIISLRIQCSLLSFRSLLLPVSWLNVPLLLLLLVLFLLRAVSSTPRSSPIICNQNHRAWQIVSNSSVLLVVVRVIMGVVVSVVSIGWNSKIDKIIAMGNE